MPVRRGTLIWTMVAVGGAALMVLALLAAPALAPAAALAIAAVAWIVFAGQRPLAAYLTVLFIFTLAYNRLALPLAVGGAGERVGTLSLGDVLWLGLVAGWLLARLCRWQPRPPALRLPRVAWLLAPYVLMDLLLPVAGVLVRGWPASFAVPGLRHLEWASFGAFAYSLARRHGAGFLLSRLIGMLLAACGLHLAYALVQAGYSVGMLSSAWIVLDLLYVAQSGFSWFHYPRVTGLLINPNAFGVFGAFVGVLGVALLLEPRAKGRATTAFTLIFALVALLMSSSRSALVGEAVALAALGMFTVGQRRLTSRLWAVGLVALLVVLVVIMVWPFLPGILQARLSSLLEMYGGTGVDENAAGRLAAWEEVWEVYVNDYPLGTWVPTGHATGLVADSYYVQSAAQGTPLFTLAWLVFLGAAAALGWQAYRRAGGALEAAAGLTLVGWAGVMVGANLTLTAMHDANLVALFWMMLGVAAAVARGRS